MKSTVYLHIGTAKTGTTAIQVFLRENQEALAAKGCMFPIWDRKFKGVRIERNAHFLSRLVTEDDFKEECLCKIEELANQYPKIILTSEGLWNCAGDRKEFWIELQERLHRSDIELKMVVYLRRQDLYVTSFWAQHIKGLEMKSDTFEGYLKNKCDRLNHLDYYDYISQVADVLGKENIIVRPYEFSQFLGKDNTIVSDFLLALDIDYDDTLHYENEIRNTSIEGSVLEAKRYLNSIPEFKAKYSICDPVFKGVQSDLLACGKLVKRATFSKGKRAEFMKKYEAGNVAIAREYLGREDGVLFTTPLPNDDPESSSYSYFVLRNVYKRLMRKHKELLKAGTKSAFTQKEFEFVCKKAMKKIIRTKLALKKRLKKCFGKILK